MARPNAVPMYRYTNFLIEKVEKGEVQASKVNPNMLVTLGGTRQRREEAVAIFKATFVDEDGSLVPVPDEVSDWVEDMSEKLLEVQTIALSSAKFETTRQLVATKEKLEEKTAQLKESSENLSETVGFLDEANRLLAEAKQEIESLKAEAEQAQIRESDLSKENDDLQSTIKNQDTQIKSFESEKLALEENVSTLRASVNAFSESAAKWEGRFEKASSDLEVVRGDLGKETHNKSLLELQCGALTARAESAEKEVLGLTGSIAVLKDGHATAIARVESEKQDCLNENGRLSERLADSQKDLAASREMGGQLKEQVIELGAKAALFEDLMKKSDSDNKVESKGKEKST